MQIKPREKIIIVEKINNAALSEDIIIAEDEWDKNLIACRIVNWNWLYPEWTIIITGKYSIYKLIYKWSDYFFLEHEDVVWTIEENV